MSDGAATPLLTPADRAAFDRAHPRDPGHFRLYFDPRAGAPDVIELQDFDYSFLDGVIFLDSVRYATEEAAETALDLFEVLAWQARPGLSPETMLTGASWAPVRGLGPRRLDARILLTAR